MTLFKSQTHQDIWIDHHCRRCYFGQGLGDPTQPQCKILAFAIGHGRKPVQWDRSIRKNATMADSIKCNSEIHQPPLVTRRVVNEDVPMFDVQATTRMDPDHA